MPKRLSKKRPSADPNQSAFRVVRRLEALTLTESDAAKPDNVVRLPARRKNQAAVALGRKGGQKSAVARMEKIGPDERSRIASNAARARWAKKDEGNG